MRVLFGTVPKRRGEGDEASNVNSINSAQFVESHLIIFLAVHYRMPDIRYALVIILFHRAWQLDVNFLRRSSDATRLIKSHC